MGGGGDLSLFVLYAVLSLVHLVLLLVVVRTTCPSARLLNARKTGHYQTLSLPLLKPTPRMENSSAKASFCL